MAELLARKPDFASRGRVLIGRLVKFADLLETIVDGLGKAGLVLDRGLDPARKSAMTPSPPASTTPPTSSTSAVRQDLTRIALAVISAPPDDRHDAVGPAPLPGRGSLGDDAGRLHLADAPLPAGPARESAGPGRRGDDAGPPAPPDPPPVGGLRHHGPERRARDGLGEDRGGLRTATAARVGGRRPARGCEGRRRLGGDGGGRPGRPRRAVAPHASDAARWALGHLGTVGGLLLHFVLVVVLSALLYANGEGAARGVRRFGRRLAARKARAPSSWPARPFAPSRWVSA